MHTEAMVITLHLSAIILLTTIPSAVPCIDCDGVNVTCVDGECLPRCVNVTSSGECLQCRDFRFWGQKCEKTCSTTCLHSRCQQNNPRHVCTDGCVPGKKGDNCEVDCPPSCIQCERNGDRCVGQMCSSSWYYGDKCEKPCPGNCRDGCKASGECFSCKHGHSGTFCNATCPAGCMRCERKTNKCVVECPIPGYYGDNCNKSCIGNCRDGCDRNEGSCHTCAPGYTGEQCNIACFPNCQICDLLTSQCSKCLDGKRGKFCNESCPSDCIYCDRYKGSCTGPCPTNSVYGRNCSFPCSLACDGCDRETGVCTACASGYSRTYCDEMCSLCAADSRHCNSKICVTRDPHLVLKVVFGILAAAVLFGLVVAVVFHRYRKRHDRTLLQLTKPRDSSGHSDQSQYWVSKYYEIDDEDLDSDSFRTVPTVPQRQPSTQQGDVQSSVSLVKREETPIRSQVKPARDIHQLQDMRGSFHSDVDSVLENEIYKSAETNTVNAHVDDVVRRVSTSSSSRSDEQAMCKARRSLEAKQTDENRSVCSVTSEDIRLTRKTESQIMWKQNTDFSKVYVKYITPNVDEANCN